MALVISRLTNETFYIGDDIRVYVSRIKGESVKVSIDAPRELIITRHEHAPPSLIERFPHHALPQFKPHPQTQATKKARRRRDTPETKLE